MNNSKEILQDATARLDYVNEELNRPDEDVIALAMCQQARTIIQDLFSAFLIANGRDVSTAPDLQTLKNWSMEYESKFSAINLEEMFCHPGRLHNDRGYCMDLDRVRACVKIANDLRGLMEK